ncbi:MAG: efflux RND transporter periplasmic adaptor subunit, partial [Longimicrobiales bacterium]
RDAPAEGSTVRAGQVLLTLSPVEGDDTYAQLVARVERLRREVDRTERLVRAEAVAERRLEEARHDLEVAQATLDAMGVEAGEGYTLRLRSPLSGVVTRRSFVLGDRVDAGAPLLTVIDPRRFWVRFQVPASRAAELEDPHGATFSPEGSDRHLAADRIVSVGSVLDPVRRTVPVTASVPNDGALRAGMLVTGRILAGEPETGIVVPAEAVRDEDGLLVAYVQIGGETFERRALQVGPSDGISTVIRSGVRRGERVVTRGAYSIRLSSLNTSEISDHGHPH